MSAESPETYSSRFKDISRGAALTLVGVTVGAVAWCLFVSFTQFVLPSAPAEGSADDKSAGADTKFYANIIGRIRGGQSYYDAAREEFAQPTWAADGFRPTSIFHWRTPIYAWVLAALPAKSGMAVIGLLAIFAVGCCFVALGRTLGPGPAFLTGLLVGPMAWVAIGDVYLFTELWAGILIVLSVAAYGLGRWPLAVTAAIAALFVRELVLPYCLLCFVLALGQRRWREVGGWIVGFGLFAAFYAWHVHQVRLQIGANEATKLDSWLKLGGTAFALAATQLSNVFLTTSHAALTAVVLPLALLGLAGWRGEAGTRAFLTCVGYLASFLVAGRPPYHAYWGLLIGPLLMLGLAALPVVARDLIAAIRRPGPVQ